jgi:hypothetical protein
MKIKNITKKILLWSVIILGVLSFNTTNAWEFDELDSLLNIQEEFSCISINNEIKNYWDYKYKIDNLFTQLLKKDETIKSKYFTKIDDITTKYLDKTGKVKQKKLYTIIGYLKCENDVRLEPRYNWTMIMDSFKLETIWDTQYLYLIKDWKKILVDKIKQTKITDIYEKPFIDWTLTDIKIHNNYITYRYNKMLNSSLSIYNIKEEKKVIMPPFTIFLKDKNIIYSCHDWFYSLNINTWKISKEDFYNLCE